MERLRILFTTAARGKVVREVTTAGHTHIMRKGVKMEFRLSSQPTFDHERVEWRARIGREWEQGKSSNVWDAIHEIEVLAGRAALRATR